MRAGGGANPGQICTEASATGVRAGACDLRTRMPDRNRHKRLARASQVLLPVWLNLPEVLLQFFVTDDCYFSHDLTFDS